MAQYQKALNLLFLLALLGLAACAPRSPSPNAVTVAPATREPAAPAPTETEREERVVTSTPTREPVAPTTVVKSFVTETNCSEPIELTVPEEIVSYKNVQFRAPITADYRVGSNFTVQECKEGIEDGEWGPFYPAHLLFKADSDLSNNFIQPEIRVFEVPEDPELYTYPLNSIAELQQILAERPEPSTWFEGAALHTGEEYLDSHYGIGVRAIVEYLQDPFFWTNNYLQYVYHGLTDDGRFFIMANFPVNAHFLMDIQGSDPLTNVNPQAIPIPEWPSGYEQQREIIEAYNQEALKRLEETFLADVTPDLWVYDYLVQSIQVGVQAPIVSTVPAACLATADVVPIAFTPDSTSILVRGSEGVRIFNLNSLEEESYIQATKNIITAALSPDGEILAWSLEDNTIQLVRISDQNVVWTLSGHTDMVTKLKFSPDSGVLVSASHDRSIRVWSMQGDELRSFQPPGEVLGIGISPDGGTLATIPFDGPVSLWDLETLEKVKDLGGTGGFDTSDAYYSPSGEFLAADLATGLYLWRVADGQLVWDENINSMAVAFSPDGRYLAYSDIGANNKVFLSTPDVPENVRSMEGHQSPVGEILFSPDSKLLASTDWLDLRVWSVEDGALLFLGKPTCP